MRTLNHFEVAEVAGGFLSGKDMGDMITGLFVAGVLIGVGACTALGLTGYAAYHYFYPKQPNPSENTK